MKRVAHAHIGLEVEPTFAELLAGAREVKATLLSHGIPEEAFARARWRAKTEDDMGVLLCVVPAPIIDPDP